MASQPPVKNTAGEGFSVEDAAVAYLAAHILAGVPWVGSGPGRIESIRCQARQDGWFFDDIVLHLSNADEAWDCGCSVKSYTVLGKKGAPKELTQSLWEQWESASASGFHRAKDALTLFAAHHSPEIRETWISLGDSARAMSAETLAERIVRGSDPSTMRRDAFKSLQRAPDRNLADDALEISRLLGRFRLAEHDLHHSDSQTATQGILLCQQALEDSRRNLAPDLWQALISYCGPIRRKGGQITLQTLLAQLARRFPLKQHRRYAADWHTLTSESRQRMESMPDRIGGLVGVARTRLLESVNEKILGGSAIVLLGESGNGKSVLKLEEDETPLLLAGAHALLKHLTRYRRQ